MAIVFAGCLGMAYTQLTTSAASIEFTRSLGGTGLHIGILGALPTGMLFMQFVAAWIANRLDYRKPLWFWATLFQRLLCVPVAAGPWLWPQVPDNVWMWAFLAIFALNQGLVHFTTPLWLSWMGDYLPRQGLNQFWGVRHLWMQLTAAAALMFSGIYLFANGGDVRTGFAVLVLIGAVVGVADILMFIKVDEPPVTQLAQAGLWEVLAGPFRHEGFRSFIAYTCFWHFAAMVGAPFISMYLLEYVGMSLFQVLTLWTFSWVGGALFSRWLGDLAERYGNRPVLILCTAIKPINMASLLVTPQSPEYALYWLAPLFMIDMVLNTGIAIATNGFLLKQSPAANRTMFIAAGTAVAGLVGGVTAVICGAWLTWMGDWSTSLGGWKITGFHVLFAISLCLRFVSAGLVKMIKEPETQDAMIVMTTIITVSRTRLLRLPLGLYHRLIQETARPIPSIPAAKITAKVPAKVMAQTDSTVEPREPPLRQSA